MPDTTIHLFITDHGVAHSEGVTRRVHPCAKLDRPVLSADAPWEIDGADRRLYIYGTVLPDAATGGYRMWYMRYPDRILYATSTDGLHWSRPDLGLVDHPGSSTNILPIRLHSPSIVYDPTASDF